jgi:hypothetical protein
LKTNSAIAKDMETFFAAKPAKAIARWDDKPGAPWPDGFVLHDYHVCAWDFRIEEASFETIVSFRGEVHHILEGTLYGNRGSMIPDVRWFYEGPEYRWHEMLRAKLEEWNTRIAEANRIERIWFRDWQWYCGNGGGT